ncbi:MAG: DUF2164 domain-containing protein [Candidatus Woesebacteria bacterium]
MNDLLSKEDREKALKEITAYFLDERNEEVGVIAANDILDFCLQNIGPSIYNKAIDDTRTALKEKLEEWDYTLSELRKE